LSENAFHYRVLLVDDEERLRELGRQVLETQGYEVHCASDGFEGLAALKKALPDMIISDLRMPNMNGFEFLSVVRHRFPAIPVVVISGEFSGVSVPQSVLADAFFPKGGYTPAELFEKISELLNELPTRNKALRPNQASVWVKNDLGMVAVTCDQCLRTFPVELATRGTNQATCDFCSATVSFEIVTEHALVN
jgi:CheY-like chemotaxis protein